MDTHYAIYNSAFHGGGSEGAHYSSPGYLISRHRSERAAIRKYRKVARAHSDCQCGAPIMVIEYTGEGRERHHYPAWPDQPVPEVVEVPGTVDTRSPIQDEWRIVEF